VNDSYLRIDGRMGRNAASLMAAGLVGFSLSFASCTTIKVVETSNDHIFFEGKGYSSDK
jgi:hypothetical protein